MSVDLIRAEALVREWHPDAELRVRRLYPRGWLAVYGWPYESGAGGGPPTRYGGERGTVAARWRGYDLSAVGATRVEALAALATTVISASMCPAWPPGPDEMALAAGLTAQGVASGLVRCEVGT